MTATDLGSLKIKGVQMNHIKALKLSSESPCSVFCKHSYQEDFHEVIVLKKKKTNSDVVTLIHC